MNINSSVLSEVDDDTLAKIALATTAGLVAVVGGRKLYKKYKEKKIEKKYLEGSQDDRQKDINSPYMTSLEPSDAIETAKYFIGAKRLR